MMDAAACKGFCTLLLSHVMMHTHLSAADVASRFRRDEYLLPTVSIIALCSTLCCTMRLETALLQSLKQDISGMGQQKIHRCTHTNV